MLLPRPFGWEADTVPAEPTRRLLLLMMLLLLMLRALFLLLERRRGAAISEIVAGGGEEMFSPPTRVAPAIAVLREGKAVASTSPAGAVLAVPEPEGTRLLLRR